MGRVEAVVTRIRHYDTRKKPGIGQILSDIQSHRDTFQTCAVFL